MGRELCCDGLTKKIFIEPELPSEADNRSAQMRIVQAVEEQVGAEEKVSMSYEVMRRLHPLCEQAEWKLTVSLAWDGAGWVIAGIEAGNHKSEHYGLAVDLGSTSIVVSVVDCEKGCELARDSEYNGQIAYGTDILSRIFYCKDDAEKLEEIRQVTVQSIVKVCEKTAHQAGINWKDCISMVIGGNTTMMHFLLGLDAFCVFSSPYALRVEKPGFLPAHSLGFELKGYVYCYPSRANYLGGDIISGMIATQMYRGEKISAFFDIGTNGELVIGSKDFLLCGAGAAGPALEGGVVRTGMRAAEGAVESVLLRDGIFENTVIGEGEPKGICGSGIIDLLAQMFLHGWIDFRGKFVPEKSPLIQTVKNPDDLDEENGRELLAVEYAPGLYFYEDDIEEFIRTKSAAFTMVQYMLQESGILPSDLDKFYVCGAFGKHVSKESAITIGMYPDMDREHIVNAGNTSLEGAVRLLLCKAYLLDIEEILDRMTYIQYGEVDNFVDMMHAAQYLPHINLNLYPSVKEKLCFSEASESEK